MLPRYLQGLHEIFMIRDAKETVGVDLADVTGMSINPTTRHAPATVVPACSGPQQDLPVRRETQRDGVDAGPTVGT